MTVIIASENEKMILKFKGTNKFNEAFVASLNIKDLVDVKFTHKIKERFLLNFVFYPGLPNKASIEVENILLEFKNLNSLNLGHNKLRVLRILKDKGLVSAQEHKNEFGEFVYTTFTPVVEKWEGK